METKINNDIKTAMLEKAEERLNALRLIKAALQVEKAKDGVDTLSDDKVIKIIKKMVNQSTESASIYSKNGRIDLMDDELFLITVFKLYLPELPEQMTEEEITQRSKEIISELGATSLKDMGKVMSVATEEFGDRAERKIVGPILKNLLLNI